MRLNRTSAPERRGDGVQHGGTAPGSGVARPAREAEEGPAGSRSFRGSGSRRLRRRRSLALFAFDGVDEVALARRDQKLARAAIGIEGRRERQSSMHQLAQAQL